MCKFSSFFKHVLFKTMWILLYFYMSTLSTHWLLNFSFVGLIKDYLILTFHFQQIVKLHIYHFAQWSLGIQLSVPEGQYISDWKGISMFWGGGLVLDSNFKIADSMLLLLDSTILILKPPSTQKCVFLVYVPLNARAWLYWLISVQSFPISLPKCLCILKSESQSYTAQATFSTS